MKIPETSANSGQYYGNEENVQWQPNGVIIESGVGGGGSGDAGLHQQLYAVPREHLHNTGYVMAGAYLETGTAYPQPHDDFEDYMWMENEEEFDKQVMQQLEEEALMEQCIEAMLEDEQRERSRPHNGHGQPTTSKGSKLSLEETISKSKLNPLAAEFVPTFVMRTVATNDDNEKPTVVSANQEVAPVVDRGGIETREGGVSGKRQEPTPETPDATESQDETSKLDMERRPSKEALKRDSKSLSEAKKGTKSDPKKGGKVAAAKSETKVPAKESVPESHPAKSESALQERPDASDVTTIAQPEECSGPKPINYAAAAKANKPKKATTPPIVDKVSSPSVPKVEKVSATKDRTKTDGKARKNSAK